MAMLLLTHIIIAFSGLIYSAVVFFGPSKTGLHAVYVLLGATLLSGTVLTITSGSALLPACLSGLAYMALTIPAIYGARLKLQKQQSKK